MPQRYTQLKDQLPVSRLTLNVLLALRLMYDDVNDVVKLDSDIEELKHFPERLSDSYRAEWESYVRRALVNEFKQHGDASPATFIASIMERVEAVQASNPRYAALMPIIERAQQVNHAENTHLFRHHGGNKLWRYCCRLPRLRRQTKITHNSHYAFLLALFTLY